MILFVYRVFQKIRFNFHGFMSSMACSCIVFVQTVVLEIKQQSTTCDNTCVWKLKLIFVCASLVYNNISQSNLNAAAFTILGVSEPQQTLTTAKCVNTHQTKQYEMGSNRQWRLAFLSFTENKENIVALPSARHHHSKWKHLHPNTFAWIVY